jgi:hypothetical protein
MTSAALSSPDMRSLLRRGESALLLVAIMFGGSLLLWVGVPLAWLWIASKVQAATDSLSAGIASALFGVPISIALAVPMLTWLSAKHRELRVARGGDDLGDFVLEVVMVISAGIALVGFSIWFFLFSGSSPIPLNLGY